MQQGIYIHLPYCVTKCPYCDFNSYGTGMDFPEDRYLDSLLGEIEMRSDILSGTRTETIFFGGGTPSLFKPESIDRIIQKISSKTALETDTEISIEVNPRTAGMDKLREFRQAGINRISIGIQSFTQGKLDFLKRFYDVSECDRIIRDVAAAGYDNCSMDIMYGLEGETLRELEYDLLRATQYGIPHISAYCLTIEEGTVFGSLHEKGMLNLPEDKVLSDMYSFASAFLDSRGYRQYEISNFSKNSYECRHNGIYWDCGNYIGFGAGAHSHITSDNEYPWGLRWSNIRAPGMYIRSVSSGDDPVGTREILDRDTAVRDLFLMGLRLRDGLVIESLERNYGIIIDRASIDYLIHDGFVEVKGGRLRISQKGIVYSNTLILKLLDSVRFSDPASPQV